MKDIQSEFISQILLARIPTEIENNFTPSEKTMPTINKSQQSTVIDLAKNFDLKTEINDKIIK